MPGDTPTLSQLHPSVLDSPIHDLVEQTALSSQRRIASFFFLPLNGGVSQTSLSLPWHPYHRTSLSLTLVSYASHSRRAAQANSLFTISDVSTFGLSEANQASTLLSQLPRCNDEKLKTLANICSNANVSDGPVKLSKLRQNHINSVFPGHTALEDLTRYKTTFHNLQQSVDKQLTRYQQISLVPITWQYTLQNHVGKLLYSFGRLLTHFLSMTSPFVPVSVINFAITRLELVSAALRHLEWNQVIRNNTADLQMLKERLGLWGEACEQSIHAIQTLEQAQQKWEETNKAAAQVRVEMSKSNQPTNPDLSTSAASAAGFEEITIDDAVLASTSSQPDKKKAWWRHWQ